MVKRPADLELVVMSRFPVEAFSVEMPRDARGRVLGYPAGRAVLDVGGRDVVVWAVHPPSPLDWWSWHARNAYHLWVAERAAAEDATTPVIVAGDYNQTPWTPWHQRFLERSGLIDAAGTSWPAPTRHPFWPFAWRAIAIPIDRLSVRPGTGVNGLHVGPFLGSDHYPVTADLVLGRPPARPAARRHRNRSGAGAFHPIWRAVGRQGRPRVESRSPDRAGPYNSRSPSGSRWSRARTRATGRWSRPCST